ncbi:MAG: hypothetical protein Q8M16_14895, partial [Pirellulaceae bacterium]|nr:hypothetical protein [Pirellulaceae bacterium]
YLCIGRAIEIRNLFRDKSLVVNPGLHRDELGGGPICPSTAAFLWLIHLIVPHYYSQAMAIVILHSSISIF